MNRMKRLLAAALTFAATLSLASCGTSNSKDSVGQRPLRHLKRRNRSLLDGS